MSKEIMESGGARLERAVPTDGLDVASEAPERTRIRLSRIRPQVLAATPRLPLGIVQESKWKAEPKSWL